MQVRYQAALYTDCLVVGKGFEPFRSSPSGQSPGFIRPRRTPVLPTIVPWCPGWDSSPHYTLPLEEVRLPIAPPGQCLSAGRLTRFPCASIRRSGRRSTSGAFPEIRTQTVTVLNRVRLPIAPGKPCVGSAHWDRTSLVSD